MQKFSLEARSLAIQLRAFENTNAVCLQELDYPLPAHNIDRPANTNDLYEIVISDVPIPEDRIPWQDIVQFRTSTDSAKLQRRLRLFIGDLAKGGISYRDAMERIPYLKDEYRRAMKTAGLKYQSSIIRSLFVAVNPLKILELGEAIAEIRKSRAILMEDEQKAVGRELAYTIRITQEFPLGNRSTPATKNSAGPHRSPP